MRHLCLVAAGLMVMAGCGGKDAAKDDATATAKPAVSPADQVAALQEKYDAAMNEFRKKYSAADPKDRQALLESGFPKPEQYAADFLKLAREYPDDPAAVEALKWVATQVRTDAKNEAVDLLLERHADSPALAEVIPMLAADIGPDAESRLRTLATTARADNVRAIAAFSLATYLDRAARAAQVVKENEAAREYFEDSLEYLEGLKVDPAEKEKLYETIVNEFPDVVDSRGQKLADRAKSALFELRNLQVGMVAPDIEGNDLDGAPFKLSDYRGKVVLLDFWGNW